MMCICIRSAALQKYINLAEERIYLGLAVQKRVFGHNGTAKAQVSLRISVV